MEEEKDKLFIKPLTPVLVDENIIYSDDVYFKTFDLVVKNLDKKAIKKIIKNFYREAKKYDVDEYSNNDIRKKHEFFKRMFNIRIYFFKSWKLFKHFKFLKKEEKILSYIKLGLNCETSKNIYCDAYKQALNLNYFLEKDGKNKKKQLEFEKK